MKNFSKMWLVPLLLVMSMAGCEKRDGITSLQVTTTPTVDSTNPVHLATGVPLNQRITTTFSEAMDSLTMTTATFTLMQGTSFVSGTVSYTGVTATFSPASNLTPNTAYTATITTMAKNLAGTALTDNYVWSFTTSTGAAVILPTISSTNPANAATGVALNQKISATFSKTMDGSTITASTFILVQGSTAISGFVSYSGSTAIFTPAINLLPNTAYIAMISTGAKDSTGYALANNYVWSFTTGAAVVVNPPTVISTDPVNGATCVPFNQKVTATFSEAMDPSTISTVTFTITKGTCYSCFISGTVSYTGTTATFTPSCDLLPNTTYTAMISTGAKGSAGNALASNYEWSFSTCAGEGVILPTVNSTSPVHDATCVDSNQKITAVFSKTMDASTITASTFTLMQGTTPVSGFVSYISKTATFTPASNLEPSTSYTATITTGAKDSAGIALANNHVWSFTTLTPYTVTLSSVPAADGTASGGGTFNSCSSVTVTATPVAGHTFTNWTENGIEVSTDASYTFTISENRTLVAHFATASSEYSVSLSSNPAIGGATSGGGTFNTGASVTVTATPNAGYTFTNWTANGTAVSTNASYTFILSGNRTLVANFTAVATTQYTVTLSSVPPLGGTTGGGGAFNSGSSVTVTATSNAGYTFTNWTENGIVVTSSTSYQFTLSGNRTLVANFTAVAPTQYTVTLSSAPPLGGTTSGGGAFNSGSSVTVIATPNAGYTFTNWTANGTAVSTNASYTFLLSGNRTLVANFTAVAPTQYTVALSSVPPLGGTTSGGGQYNSGSSVTAIATPNTGYTFTNWTENGTPVSTNASYTFLLSGNRTLVANFISASQYAVSVSSLPPDAGEANGGGTFNSGSSVTVTALAYNGHAFTKWTENGATVSTDESYTFIINGNRVLVANFGQSRVYLGAAEGFAVLSASAITDIPSSSITGDVGISPGARSSITGLTIPEVNGTIYAADDASPVPAMLIAAKSAAESAYNNAMSPVRGTPIPISGNINGLTLVPGLYSSGSSIEISPGGMLYLDAQGDVNAVFVIRSATSITTESTSQVILAGGARASNIFWAAGSAVTLGTNSVMQGTIIASSSISLLTGARLEGRALIQGPAAGQISMDQNTIVRY